MKLAVCRYMVGLPAAKQKFMPHGAASHLRGNGSLPSRRRNSTGCGSLVDTTSYLHSRWVPLRVHAALRQDRPLSSSCKIGALLHLCNYLLQLAAP